MHKRNAAKTLFKLALLSSIAAVACSLFVLRADEIYDIAILNGRVIDPESGLDAVRNVGVRGGKIAAVSATPLSAKSTIDAKGLVVAPGFIDTPVIPKLLEDPGALPMKPISAERCVTEGLEALRANRAVYIPGLLNRIMNRLVPPSVAQKMEAKMLKK